MEYPVLFGSGKNGATLLTLKAHNRRVLLLALLRSQPISRVRLARLCGLSTTTVTKMVAELMALGVVSEAGPDIVAVRPGAGRPPLALQLVAESRTVIGIHIGAHRVRLALCDVNAQLLARCVLPIQAREPAEACLARIAAAARSLLDQALIDQALIDQVGDPIGDGAVDGRLLGVGIGASGLTDTAAGINVMAPNLGWRNVPVRELMHGMLGLPVMVDNNMRCIALAESLYGAGRGVDSMAYVHAGMGAGAGFIVDGDLYRGAGFGAGEIGHWTMLPRGGRRCRCGNNGCLETLISEPGIVERARQIDPYVVEQSEHPLQAIFAEARRGHAGLRSLMGETGFYLGIALANLINVMNPELIVLGGLLQEGFDLLRVEVENTMRRHVFGGLGERVALVPATFGEYAGEIGAAALALDQFLFRRPTGAVETSAEELHLIA